VIVLSARMGGRQQEGPEARPRLEEPAVHLEELVEEGVGFAGFAAGETGQGPISPTSWRGPI
jgi:hypothetical protein